MTHICTQWRGFTQVSAGTLRSWRCWDRPGAGGPVGTGNWAGLAVEEHCLLLTAELYLHLQMSLKLISRDKSLGLQIGCP